MSERKRRLAHRPIRRRGATTAGLILGMTALIAVAAVAIDFALLTARHTEVNGLAESASLAGVQHLWDRTTLPAGLETLDLYDDGMGGTIPEKQARNAIAAARLVGVNNTVAGEAYGDNSGAAYVPGFRETDFVFDLNGTTSEPVPATPFNALHASVEFSNARGNGVSYVLGSLLGLTAADVIVVREARLDQRVVGFVPNSIVSAPIAPLVYLESTGHTWDGAAATAGLGGEFSISLTISGGAESGDAVLATLSPADASPATGASPFTATQIAGGLYDVDLAGLGGQFALSGAGGALDLETANVGGGAGILSSIAAAVDGLAGECLVFPLGTTVTTAGPPADDLARRVTGFAAGRIVSANYDGPTSTLTVLVEPCIMLTNSARLANGQPLNPYIGRTILAP